MATWWMKNNNMKNRILLFFLPALMMASAFSSCAQEVDADAARALYPDARAIILKSVDDYKIYMEDGKLKATCNTHRQIFINKETGIVFQNKSIPTNTFVQAGNINAYTLVPKGNKKYEKKKVEKIELKDDHDESSFYDEEKSYRFMFPSVQVGAILDETYEMNYLDPHFIGSFGWTGYLPFIENELVITVQKNININYKLFHQNSLNIEFTKEDRKNETVYRWKAKNINPIQRYSNAPDYRYYEPHMIFYITDYQIDKISQRLLGSPKDLYSWYYDLQKNVNKTEDAKLKHVTDSLITGVHDEMEKVRRIFYWVQDNISYVAFEDGLGGFIPRDACTVYSKKYGDCKDMASIIHEMLRMAGIKSYLTWIGSRDIPYNYIDVPTPSVDNHMITSYLDPQNKWHFLDGTGKKAPEDLYTSFIQGKQALIGISKDSFQLVTVPVKDTDVSQTIDSISIEIKDNLVTGNGKVMLTGYDALNYTYQTETMSKDERQDFFKGNFAKGNNKVKFTDIVTTQDDRKPLHISYKFDLPDYVRKDQDELYINLNMNKNLTLEALDETRKIPLGFLNKTKKRDVTVLKIPEGYKVDYVPVNVRFGNDIAGYSCSYEVKNNEVILSTDFYIETLLLEAKDFQKFNSVLNEQVKANKQVISLIKK
jgi:transglutaminase-like putative cysteine protease